MCTKLFCCYTYAAGLSKPKRKISMFQTSSLSQFIAYSNRVPGRACLAASLAISGLGWSASSGAQPLPPPSSAIAVSSAGAQVPPAESSSAATPGSRPQAFVTAPSLKSLGEATPPEGKQANSGSTAAPLPDQQRPAIPVPSAPEEDAPWLLGPDMRPWALAYLEAELLNSLYLMLPADREARIMLPGAALDASERAATEISRYFIDNNGLASVARTRQLETLNAWLADTSKKKMALPQDPWVEYQFHKEANATLQGFKAKVVRQSEPVLRRMASDIKKTVDQLTGIMNATGSHEQKMNWYNLLLQLKDGFSLFQARAVASDQQILALIERYETENPPPPRPAGKPPQSAQGAASTPAQAASNVALTADTVERQKAPAPTPAPQNNNQAGGWIVILGMLATVMGLFYKMRRRVAGKPTASEPPAS